MSSSTRIMENVKIKIKRRKSNGPIADEAKITVTPGKIEFTMNKLPSMTVLVKDLVGMPKKPKRGLSLPMDFVQSPTSTWQYMILYALDFDRLFQTVIFAWEEPQPPATAAAFSAHRALTLSRRPLARATTDRLFSGSEDDEPSGDDLFPRRRGARFGAPRLIDGDNSGGINDNDEIRAELSSMKERMKGAEKRIEEMEKKYKRMLLFTGRAQSMEQNRKKVVEIDGSTQMNGKEPAKKRSKMEEEKKEEKKEEEKKWEERIDKIKLRLKSMDKTRRNETIDLLEEIVGEE